MAPLKSLERKHPIIDSDFQQFCASHGIFSVEDLLVHDLYVLVALAEQQSSADRLKQGITEVLSIIDAQHQPWLNGLDLLEDALQNKHVLSTGCHGIDMLLQGGLRQGHLTELVGPSSAGKTQICLQAASNVAKKHMGGVVFLDTGNSFSPKRIAHFINQTSVPAEEEANHIILQKVMRSISCYSVFDFFTLMDVLNQLNINLKSQVKLLIVDSISSLITPILGGRGSHGHAMMISAGYLLKKLAHEHNLCVLVTNHMVGGEGGSTKPALGESWKSVPHVQLQLSCHPKSNVYKMSILRHTYMASGKAVEFTIL